MQVGILTAPFGGEPLETAVEFAGKAGFDALEVIAGPGSKHIDTANLSSEKVAAIRKLMLDNGVEISSLAYYTNVTDPDKRPEMISNLKACVDAAHELGTSIVCTLAGMPVTGKDKMKTIEEDCVEVFHPVVEYAEKKGIKIALENWYATNIQNLAHWERIFQVVPHENFGLNYDPSHLLWQGIDYIDAVYQFKDRIFHTHAKDVQIKEHVLRVVGNQASGWWKYVIPGFGKVRWGEYVAALRAIGYDGVLSIEHEDGTIGREEGFVKGKDYLKLFV